MEERWDEVDDKISSAISSAMNEVDDKISSAISSALSGAETRWDTKFEEINAGFAELKQGFQESRQENDERFTNFSKQFQQVLAALLPATTGGGSEIVTANEGDETKAEKAQDSGPANSPNSPVSYKTGDDLQAAVSVSKSKSTILVLALILFVVYVAFGVFTYYLFRDEFSGTKTDVWVDAVYFSIVTLCTVGYGDIVPASSTTKIFTIALISLGVVSLDFLLNRLANHILSLQEEAILDRLNTGNRIIKDEDGRIRLRWKLGAALCVVIFSVAMGTCVLHRSEQLEWIDSLYLAVVTISTVRFGDKAIMSVEGRLFAIFWIIFSTISMVCLFIYVAELKIGHRKVLKLPTSESELIISSK